MSGDYLVAFVPLDAFLVRLAQGWRFERLVVGPMAGYPGNFSCLMTREAA